MFSKSAVLVALLSVAVPLPLAAGTPTDATKLALEGVRLSATGEQAEAAVRAANFYEQVNVAMTRCHDHVHECFASIYASNDGSHLSVYFRPDLPDHPERSLVSKVEIKYNSARLASNFLARVVGEYGKWDAGSLYDGTVWWGALGSDVKPGSAELRGVPQRPYLRASTVSGSFDLVDPKSETKRDTGSYECDACRSK